MRDLEQPHTANMREFPAVALKQAVAAIVENPGSIGVEPPVYTQTAEFDMTQPLSAPHQDEQRPGSAAYL